MEIRFPRRTRDAARALALAWALCGLGACATAAGPREAGAARHAHHLASVKYEGRQAGTAGEKRAAQYLVEQLTALGARPVPGQKDLRIPFEFMAEARATRAALALTSRNGAQEWAAGEDFAPASFSGDGTAAGEVIFAGYGENIPLLVYRGGGRYGSQPFIGSVLLVREWDGQAGGALPLRDLAAAADDLGAEALLIVHDEEALEVPAMTRGPEAPLPVVTISGAVAEALLRPTGMTLETAAAELRAEQSRDALAFLRTTSDVQLEVRLEREWKTGINVVGVLPSTIPRQKAEQNPGLLETPEYVGLGAHYDHLGYGMASQTLARPDEAHLMHPGADDNASGVGAVLEAARRLMSLKERPRPVLIAFWSAEEYGLAGSRAFLSEGVLPPGEIIAYVNLDMVGRMRDDRLIVQAVRSSSIWRLLTENANQTLRLELEYDQSPYTFSDSVSFHHERIPTLNLYTGLHSDYHKPSDRPEALNDEGIERSAVLAARLCAELMAIESRPSFVTEPSSTPAERPFLGVIPDGMSGELPGVRITQLVPGGPAQTAGLRPGDRIVRIGERRVGTAPQLFDAVNATRAGDEVGVEVLRGPDSLEVKVRIGVRY
ncbi:MAG: M20/M25/M40 family metallo-hydrolase [Sumerlaeia bacterium]